MTYTIIVKEDNKPNVTYSHDDFSRIITFMKNQNISHLNGDTLLATGYVKQGSKTFYYEKN